MVKHRQYLSVRTWSAGPLHWRHCVVMMLILIHFNTGTIFKTYCWQPGAVNIHQPSASHYTYTTLGCIYALRRKPDQTSLMLSLLEWLHVLECFVCSLQRLVSSMNSPWYDNALRAKPPAGPYRIINSHNSTVAIRGKLGYYMTAAVSLIAAIAFKLES